MKIKKLNKHRTKLLKLKLLKTKIYKTQTDFDYLALKDIEIRLKKVLHVIYKFHVANKKILFIGTPLKLNNQIKQLLKGKKHSFIPESIWINGIITNSAPSFKYLLKKDAISNKKNSQFLFNLKNQIDLIVVLNEKLNKVALEESSVRKIPTISLNADFSSIDFNSSTYKAPGDYSFGQSEIRKNLFFLLLGSLLKKAELLRKKQAKMQIGSNKIKTPRRKKVNYKQRVSSKQK